MAKGMRKMEQVRRAAIHRTIPTSRKTVAVNGTTSQNLGAVTADDGPDTATARNLGGLFVWLAARTVDITIQRANAPDTAGIGVTLLAGAPAMEFYIDSDEDLVLHLRSAAAGSLDIMWDDDQVGA